MRNFVVIVMTFGSVLGVYGSERQPEKDIAFTAKVRDIATYDYYSKGHKLDDKITISAKGVIFDTPETFSLAKSSSINKSDPISAVKSYLVALKYREPRDAKAFWHKDSQKDVSYTINNKDNDEKIRTYWSKVKEIKILGFVHLGNSYVVFVNEGYGVVPHTLKKTSAGWLLSNYSPDEARYGVIFAALNGGDVKVSSKSNERVEQDAAKRQPRRSP